MALSHTVNFQCRTILEFYVLEQQKYYLLCDYSTSSEVNTVRPTWLLKVLLLAARETTQQSICELRGKKISLHKGT